MSINFKIFEPRPGLVNKQGRLPDPSELVCVEIPKIFDQCLIKRCLVYGECQDTKTSDEELRSDPLTNPKRYISSREFNLNLISVDKIPLKSNSNFKKVILNYSISFYADYIDESGATQSELFEINRTDTIGKFYCPDSVAQMSLSSYENNGEEASIIKLEMVAEVLDGEIVEDEDSNSVLDITLGYFIVVKSQLTVQLLVPVYDYCPIPKEACEDDQEEDPCEIFEKTPIPKFYPDQNLEALFEEDEEN